MTSRRKKYRERIFLHLAESLEGSVPCYCCGFPVSWPESTLEHIVPRCKGGGDEIENHAISHAGCNNAKGGSTKRRSRFRVSTEQQRDLMFANILRINLGEADFPDDIPF